MNTFVVAVFALLAVASASPYGYGDLGHGYGHHSYHGDIGPSGIVTGHGASGPSGHVDGHGTSGPAGHVNGHGAVGPSGEHSSHGHHDELGYSHGLGYGHGFGYGHALGFGHGVGLPHHGAVLVAAPVAHTVLVPAIHGIHGHGHHY